MDEGFYVLLEYPVTIYIQPVSNTHVYGYNVGFEGVHKSYQSIEGIDTFCKPAPYFKNIACPTENEMEMLSLVNPRAHIAVETILDYLNK